LLWESGYAVCLKQKKRALRLNGLTIENIGQLHAEHGHFKDFPPLVIVINTPVGYFIQLTEAAHTFSFMIEGTNTPAWRFHPVAVFLLLV